MMEWKEIASTVGKIAPLLGPLLAGPAGVAVTIGGVIASALGVDNTPDAVSQAISINPDAAVKLAQIEKDKTVELQGLAVTSASNILAADTQRILAVNATMQAEAGSEHWPSYSWRPFIGFIAGAMLFGCYFVLPLRGIPVPPVPESAWIMIGAVLGVASWYRGKMQADPSIPTNNKG